MSSVPSLKLTGQPEENWVERVRFDFPILRRRVRGHPLAYLDNAATTQKPRQVIEALVRFYEQHNANVHRGVYTLSEEASQKYEEAREKVANFIHASSARSIVFTRGTTESINLVAHSWLKPRLEPGDQILVSRMEHHSNLVPWQMAAREKRARIRYIPLTPQGSLDLNAFEHCITPGTRMLALCHISNVLGSRNPLEEVIEIARSRQIPVLVDAAQSVSRTKVDVAALDCDFLAFSSHKMYGPTGIGVLYGKTRFLGEMEPLMGGGGMIRQVGEEQSVWTDFPAKFEAGTPPLAEAVGLAAAIDYLEAIGMDNIERHERKLMAHALALLRQFPGVTIYPPLDCHQKIGVLSFNIGDVHPHDVAQILDSEGVAVRAGHHCAQPLMRTLGVSSTVRLSFALYNILSDIDQLARGLEKVRDIFLRNGAPFP